MAGDGGHGPCNRALRVPVCIFGETKLVYRQGSGTMVEQVKRASQVLFKLAYAVSRPGDMTGAKADMFSPINALKGIAREMPMSLSSQIKRSGWMLSVRLVFSSPSQACRQKGNVVWIRTASHPKWGLYVWPVIESKLPAPQSSR
jgi:hypothetical protein